MVFSRRNFLRNVGAAGLVLLGNGFKGIWKTPDVPGHCLLQDGAKTVLGRTKIHAPVEYTDAIIAHLQFLKTVVGRDYVEDLEGILFVRSEAQGCEHLGLGSEGSVAGRIYLAQLDTMVLDTNKHLRLQPSFKIGETPRWEGITLVDGKQVKTLYGGPIHRQVGSPVIEPYFAGWDQSQMERMGFEYEVDHELGHHLYDRDFFGDDPEGALEKHNLLSPCLFRAVVEDRKKNQYVIKNKTGDDFETSSCEPKFSIDEDIFEEHVHVYIYAEMLTALRLLTENSEYNPHFESHDLQIAKSSRKGLEYEVLRRGEVLEEEPEEGGFLFRRGGGDDCYKRPL